MKVAIEVASLGDRQLWNAIHSRSQIASHSWTFSQALSYSGITPQLASIEIDGSVLILPFYERRWGDHVDICTILSVSGAVIRPAIRPDLLSVWAQFSTTKGWVAGYLQFEPETDLMGMAGSAPGNRVFLLDLSECDLLARASAIVRRKVRRAEKLGVRVVEDRQALAEAMQHLYPLTMARSGASAHYQFSGATLACWTLDPGAIAIGAASDSQIEAVAVFPFVGERAEYHVGVADNDSREMTAWLLWQGMIRLRNAGVKSLNLGGGVRPGDGLYRFKEWFGGRSASLHVVRQIYQPEAYDRLRLAAGVPADTTWFPAYRAGEFVKKVDHRS